MREFNKIYLFFKDIFKTPDGFLLLNLQDPLCVWCK